MKISQNKLSKMKHIEKKISNKIITDFWDTRVAYCTCHWRSEGKNKEKQKNI